MRSLPFLSAPPHARPSASPLARVGAASPAAALAAGALLLAACAGTDPQSAQSTDGPGAQQTTTGEGEGDGADDADGATERTEFTTTEHATFDEGWSMAFLPGTDLLLIAERGGAMHLRDQTTGELTEVTGVPEVHHAGQAGLHDVLPAPSFAEDGALYLSWVRTHQMGSQGLVARGYLDTDTGALTVGDPLWEQTPATGDGHYSLRLLLDEDHLYITSGDRQEMTPAQETRTNLGTVVRLDHAGAPAPGNPWAQAEGVAPQIFTLGHRNPLGIAADADGQVWVSEMGPQGGDELNLLQAGENYGWPEVSMGEHYDGTAIPDHREGDGYRAPATFWVPAISPGSLTAYDADLFDGWRGSMLLGGLSGQTLVRVALDGQDATVAEQWDMGERIRAVQVAPDGAVWLLEDGADGRLLELRPA